MLISGLFLIAISIVRRHPGPQPAHLIAICAEPQHQSFSSHFVFFRFFLLATALVIPQFLAGVQGLRDEQVGPVLSLVALLQFGIAFVVAFALRGVNSRLLMATGFAIIGVTALFCSRVTSEWAPRTYIPYAVFFAIGESFAMPCLCDPCVIL